MVLIKWSCLYIMTYFSSLSSSNSVYQKEEIVNKIFSIKLNLKLKVPLYYNGNLKLYNFLTLMSILL